MKFLRLLFFLCVLCALARDASAYVTNVEALVTFTNDVRGVTNGDTITISGDVRRYTNGTLNAVATWIQSTNIAGYAATNTWLHLATYTPTGIERTFCTNTNAIIIVSLFGVFPTVSLSSGVGTVSYVTNVWADAYPIMAPNAALPTEAARTNNASDLIGLLNDNRQTNAVANGVAALSNLLDRLSHQFATNKTFRSTTNEGGLIDGARITNAVALNASNAIIAFTYLSGSGAIINTSTLHAVYITGVSNLSGLVGSLTNGVLWSNVITRSLISNSVFSGTVTLLTNGYWTNAVLDAPYLTNAMIAGLLNPDSLDNDSLELGFTNNITAGLSHLTAGFYNTNSGAGSFIFGAQNDNSQENSIVIGLNNRQRSTGSDSITIGRDNTTSNSTGHAISIGTANINTNRHTIIIGSSGRSTEDGQVLFPGGTNSVRVEGRLILDTGATNFQTLANSTNILRGDISFPRASYTSVSSAGAHNTIPLGTNVVMVASGSPSAAFPVGGLSGGARDGRWNMVWNTTGYEGTIWSNDGSITAADRITTLTATNMSWPSGSWLFVWYDTSSSRWIMQMPPMTALTAQATNALATLATNGALVTSAWTNLNLIYGTNMVIRTTNTSGTVDLHISSAGGGGASFTGTTNYIPLRPTTFIPALTNGAYADRTLQTPFLAFPHTNGVGSVIALSAIAGELMVPHDYATNTLAIELGAMLTATNGPNTSNAVFQATILRHNTTGQTSTNDAQVGPFDAGSSTITFAFAASYTGTNKVQTSSITITNCALAAGEPFSLKLERLNADAADLIGAGVVGITHARLFYTRP